MTDIVVELVVVWNFDVLVGSDDLSQTVDVHLPRRRHADTNNDHAHAFNVVNLRRDLAVARQSVSDDRCYQRRSRTDGVAGEHLVS